MRAIKVKNDSYDTDKLEAIYQNLVAAKASGTPQDYEIRVDDFPVIPRNSDPSRFMGYAGFITPGTRYISIFLYRPGSNVSDKYFFHLQNNPFIGLINGMEPGLPQLESDARHKERLRKEMQFEQLETENTRLKKEIAELEESVIRLHREKIHLIEEGNKGWKGLLKGASDFIGSSRFGKEIKAEFFGESMSGVPHEKEQQSSSFQRRENEDEAEFAESVVIGEEDKPFIQLLKDIKERVDEVELADIMHLLDLVSEHPRSIPFALKQVAVFIKNKKKKEKT